MHLPQQQAVLKKFGDAFDGAPQDQVGKLLCDIQNPGAQPQRQANGVDGINRFRELAGYAAAGARLTLDVAASGAVCMSINQKEIARVKLTDEERTTLLQLHGVQGDGTVKFDVSPLKRHEIPVQPRGLNDFGKSACRRSPDDIRYAFGRKANHIAETFKRNVIRGEVHPAQQKHYPLHKLLGHWAGDRLQDSKARRWRYVTKPLKLIGETLRTALKTAGNDQDLIGRLSMTRAVQWTSCSSILPASARRSSGSRPSWCKGPDSDEVAVLRPHRLPLPKKPSDYERVSSRCHSKCIVFQM